ncbi:hypothetical protein GGG16DRAFT_85511 [Schizophyllum commune]
MNYFHTEFKRHFDELYDLADGSFSKKGWNLNLYLRSALSFIDHLNMHHTIEERFWFPYLAKRMPQFSHKDRGEHVVSHEGIHEGNNHGTSPDLLLPAFRT